METPQFHLPPAESGESHPEPSEPYAFSAHLKATGKARRRRFAGISANSTTPSTMLSPKNKRKSEHVN